MSRTQELSQLSHTALVRRLVQAENRIGYPENRIHEDNVQSEDYRKALKAADDRANAALEEREASKARVMEVIEIGIQHVNDREAALAKVADLEAEIASLKEAITVGDSALQLTCDELFEAETTISVLRAELRLAVTELAKATS